MDVETVLVAILSGGVVSALVDFYRVRARRRVDESETDENIAGAYKTLVKDLRGQINDLKGDLTAESAECEERIAEVELICKNRINALEGQVLQMAARLTDAGRIVGGTG